jgi:hypothetical protein
VRRSSIQVNDNLSVPYDSERAADKVALLAPRLKARGIRVQAVRLDSGDLAWHARQARHILDAAGLQEIGGAGRLPWPQTSRNALGPGRTWHDSVACEGRKKILKIAFHEGWRTASFARN